MERTLVLVKPDGVQRGLIGEIIHRLEVRGLKIIGLKMMKMTSEMAAQHYREHVNKSFYPSLVQFMTGAPLVALAVEGVGAVMVCRKMSGATFGIKAEPGTIRGDYALSTSYNVVHSSESIAAAQWELPLFFQPQELFEYTRPIDSLVNTAEDIAKAQNL